MAQSTTVHLIYLYVVMLSMIKYSKYEPGYIVTGKVIWNAGTDEYMIKSEDGTCFSILDYLKSQYGSEVRVTCVRMDSLKALEDHLQSISTTDST